MRLRLNHPRSPLFVLTAWLCAALHLALFTASGWHFHTPHNRTHAPASDTAAECASPVQLVHRAHSACAHSCAHESHHDPHAAVSETQSPCERPNHPRDGRDPEECCICMAIFALLHAAPAVPITLVAPPAQVSSAPSLRAHAIAAAPQRNKWSRGPPMTGS